MKTSCGICGQLNREFDTFCIECGNALTEETKVIEKFMPIVEPIVMGTSTQHKMREYDQSILMISDKLLFYL